jgi:thymidylate kinase
MFLFKWFSHLCCCSIYVVYYFFYEQKLFLFFIVSQFNVVLMVADDIFVSSLINNEGVIALDSVDKSGKGTTFRHLVFALSELGYNVLGVPFPLYNYIDGQLIEMGLSQKGIKEHAVMSEYLDAKSIGVDKTYFLHLYPSNRLRALATIREYQKKGYIIVTKRSSKATHAAYQVGLNGFSEEQVMALDNFFPDPTILVNLLSRQQSLDNFSAKGSSVLDMNESRPQDKVVSLLKKYTQDPALVGAQYGFFVPALEAPERLHVILERVLPLLEEKGFARKSARGDLKIFGLEEPVYRFREAEGFGHFLRDYDAAKFVESVMGRDYWENYTNLDVAHRYLKLFTHPVTGKCDPYPLSVRDAVDTVIAVCKK